MNDYHIRHPGSGRAKQWREKHREERKRKQRAWRRESADPIINVHKGMLSRCHNPKDQNYKRYGARGITVCKTWHEFATFRTWALTNGWKQGMHVHRTNNQGHYAPDNCQVITVEEHMKIHGRWNALYIKYLEKQIKDLQRQLNIYASTIPVSN